MVDTGGSSPFSDFIMRVIIPWRRLFETRSVALEMVLSVKYNRASGLGQVEKGCAGATGT